MMWKPKYFVCILAGVLILCASVTAQKIEPIPKTATILETQTLSAKRKLVLWMPDPAKHPNDIKSSDIYTCPDQTRGSYYTGEVRVTLINSLTDKPVNTLRVKGSGEGGSDTIDIPYLISGGYYYN